MRSKGVIGLTVVVLSLAGCGKFSIPGTQIGAVQNMAPKGGSWTASKHARGGVDRAWVKRFNDGKLERLVAEAVASNPDMRVAGERVRQAEQAAFLAGASSRVKSSVGLSGERRKTVFVGLPFSGSNISDNYGINWMVNWEPDVWGKVRAGVEAAVADAQAVELQRRSAESSLAARVCKAWFALCEANEQFQLAEDSHEIRVRTMESIRGKFELALSGEGGSASQLRLAETDVATSLATKAQRAGEVDVAKRQLELLLGRYPAGVVGGNIKLPKIPARPPAGLPSELLLRRPDILAAERRFTAKSKRIDEAYKTLYPSFKLTASTGTTTDSLSKILSSKFGVWSLGTNLTQNILTGGVVKGEIKTRKSKEREALADLQSTVLKAFGEVEGALARDKWLTKRIEEMQKALDLANDAAKAAEEDFSEANTDALTVLTAQTRRIEIASSVVLLRRLQLDNRVNLHLALGGEFRSQGK